MRELIKSRYFKWGMTICLSLVGAVVIYLILDKFSAVHGAIGSIFGILSPFIYGVVMAYLLRPVYNGCYYRIEKGMKRLNVKSERRIWITSSVVSVTLSMLLLFVILAGLFVTVIPQFLTSLYEIITRLPSEALRFIDWVQGIDFVDPRVKKLITNTTDTLMGNIDEWMSDTLVPYVKEMALKVSVGLVGAASFLFDLVVGFIVCVYVLLSKNNFSAQAKKISYSIFEKDTANTVINGARYVDKVFNGFISGNIIDAACVAGITFVAMHLFGWPFELLISVIIGVTNLIPFFGPFIGGAIAAVLILTEEPMNALYFLLFILALQQVDGNILKPKILGDSTDLPSFWILFAIIVGGGLFGFVGMILGVPVFTVIYSFIRWILERRLSKKNLPKETQCYENVDYYDYDKGEFVFLPDNLIEDRKETKKKERQKRKEARRARFRK